MVITIIQNAHGIFDLMSDSLNMAFMSPDDAQKAFPTADVRIVWQNGIIEVW